MLTDGFPFFLCLLFYALIPALCCLFSAKGLIHFFQLESYQFPGFAHTLKRNLTSAVLPGILSCLFSLALYVFSTFLLPKNLWVQMVLCLLLLVLSALFGFMLSKLFTPKKAKKKMVYTGRLKRLYIFFFLVMTVLGMVLAKIAFFVPMLWPLLLPVVLAFSGLLAWPVEKLISECYFRDARRKLLSNPDLIRIGITGSYGKTSVKHILGTILAEKYPLLYTPASFNTPMGVTRTIREKLLPSHRIFIGEMGARHVGDIKELCRLVHPTIGLITSVGPQHLETFHSIDRVASTKYELIEALPDENSHAYFWNDGAFCSEMYRKTHKPKTLCGCDSSCDCWVEELSVTPQGSHFILHLGSYGEIACSTRLLGEHNLQNILLSASCAADLGLTLRQIAHGVAKLEPVHHRLEILPNAGGFTVIDDAFNTNPVSSKAALKVLSAFEGRKIVITPGMVELGEKEPQYNREFGQSISKVADIAIIIGKKRVQPIMQGLRESGFSEENLYQVSSLEESTKLLHQIVHPGDVVLYENDLPDHYQEA